MGTKFFFGYIACAKNPLGALPSAPTLEQKYVCECAFSGNVCASLQICGTSILPSKADSGNEEDASLSAAKTFIEEDISSVVKERDPTQQENLDTII